ncbi:Uncharacterised protein [Mycobacteroides abscessus subsp. abscessus]|nr:Uncharacterised protein [Mycobacteroides abscessus subsp. abscessus]
MRDYMVHVSLGSDGLIHCAAYIDGFHPETSDWMWLPIHDWTFPTSKTKLADTLAKELSGMGWHTADTLPDDPSAGLPVELTVTPLSRIALLSTVKEHRHELERQAAVADAALSNLLADVPPAQEEGHIPASALAGKLNLTRQWIHRLVTHLTKDIAAAWPDMSEVTRDRAQRQLTEREREALKYEEAL